MALPEKEALHKVDLLSDVVCKSTSLRVKACATTVPMKLGEVIKAYPPTSAALAEIIKTSLIPSSEIVPHPSKL